MFKLKTIVSDVPGRFWKFLKIAYVGNINHIVLYLIFSICSVS